MSCLIGVLLSCDSVSKRIVLDQFVLLVLRACWKMLIMCVNMVVVSCFMSFYESVFKGVVKSCSRMLTCWKMLIMRVNRVVVSCFMSFYESIFKGVVKSCSRMLTCWKMLIMCVNMVVVSCFMRFYETSTSGLSVNDVSA